MPDHLWTVPDAGTTRINIRKRPAMYIGDVQQPGLLHLISEVVSNSLDQVLQGFATFIDVELQPDGRSLTVRDDGAGLPFEMPGPEGYESLASSYLTSLHHSASVDGHAPHVHLHRLRGVGVVAANVLARNFVCQSWRSGQLWQQTFLAGDSQGPPRVIETGSGRGTEIRLEPDPDIFNDTRIDPTRLGEMLEEACFLYPGIRISLNKQLFHAPGGLADLARRLLETSTVNDRWGDRPAFSMQESFDDMMIHAAAVGYAENSTHCCSWVNYQKTPAGGTHQTAFTHALRTAGWKPQILLIHTIMRDARFAGPTRQMLDMPELQNTIAERIQPLLSDYCRQKSLRAD